MNYDSPLILFIFSVLSRSAAQQVLPSSSQATQRRTVYKYVSDPDPAMDWASITDRAANTIFWTELFRGKLFSI